MKGIGSHVYNSLIYPSPIPSAEANKLSVNFGKPVAGTPSSVRKCLAKSKINRLVDERIILECSSSNRRNGIFFPGKH